MDPSYNKKWNKDPIINQLSSLVRIAISPKNTVVAQSQQFPRANQVKNCHQCKILSVFRQGPKIFFTFILELEFKGNPPQCQPPPRNKALSRPHLRIMAVNNSSIMSYFLIGGDTLKFPWYLWMVNWGMPKPWFTVGKQSIYPVLRPSNWKNLSRRETPLLYLLDPLTHSESIANSAVGCSRWHSEIYLDHEMNVLDLHESRKAVNSEDVIPSSVLGFEGWGQTWTTRLFWLLWLPGDTWCSSLQWSQIGRYFPQTRTALSLYRWEPGAVRYKLTSEYTLLFRHSVPQWSTSTIQQIMNYQTSAVCLSLDSEDLYLGVSSLHLMFLREGALRIFEVCVPGLKRSVKIRAYAIKWTHSFGGPILSLAPMARTRTIHWIKDPISWEHL